MPPPSGPCSPPLPSTCAQKPSSTARKSLTGSASEFARRTGSRRLPGQTEDAHRETHEHQVGSHDNEIRRDSLRSRILLLPEFETVDDVVENLTRAAFHIGHTEPEEVRVIVRSDLVDTVRTAIAEAGSPTGYDTVAGDRLQAMTDRIEVVPQGSSQEEKALALSDVIAIWDEKAFDASRWAIERGNRQRNLTIFDIDTRTGRLGASNYAEMAHRIAGDRWGTEHRRFQAMIETLPRRRTSYLVGPDSSARSVLDHDVSEGTTIVCGTAILDADIVRHTRPQIVTFSDPTMHFGPSARAARFREAVRRSMAVDPSLWTIIPMRHRSLLVSLMPEHDDRIIGIPFQGGPSVPNLDLLTKFSVFPSADILTLLMLPLATTLTRRIGIIGFDGRAPGDEGVREQAVTNQLGHRSESTRHGDSRFPDHDHEDYEEHIAYLRRFLESAEASGIVASSLTDSDLGPLRSRFGVWSRGGVGWSPSPVEGRPAVLAVAVDPDWDSAFGHHGPWFRAFAGECDRLSIPSLCLASRALVTSDERALPTFSYPTRNPLAAPIYAPQFEIELASALDGLAAGNDSEMVVFFYCADVWHLPAIIRLADRWRGRLKAHVNLMRAHRFVTDQAGRSNPDPSQLRALGGLLEIAGSAGVRVYVDTEPLADIVEDMCQIRPAEMPMAAAANPDPATGERDGPLVVYCAVLSQEAKGAIEFARAAASLADVFAGRVEFRMRHVRQPGGTASKVTAAIESARSAGVGIIEGYLTDDRFAELVGEADIVVVPNRASSFRTRTSAAVVDAVRAGKPVVVADGTWGSSVVAEMGAGVPFRSEDVDDLTRAIIEAVNRYPSLRDRAIAAAPAARERFSMASLVEFLLSDTAGPASAESTDLERVADLEAILMSHIEGQARGRSAADREIARASSSLAEERRAVEQLTIRNEELRRAIASRDEVRHRLEKHHETALAAATGKLETHAERLREATDALRGSADRVRELEAHVRELEGASEALEASRAQVRELEAEVQRLEQSVAYLERGVANRVLQAAKRSVRR